MKWQWSEWIQSNSTSCPRHQTGKGHIQSRRHKIRTARAEIQEGSFYPVDGLAILNEMNKKS